MPARLPAVDGPSAAEILRPTLMRGDHAGIIFDSERRIIAVIPLHPLSMREAETACLLSSVLTRGLLVVV